MTYVYDAECYPKRESFATAEAAIAAVEAHGSGRVTKFHLRPNLPGCWPVYVHNCVGLWSYRDGTWNHHYIYDGHGGVLDHTKPD